MPAITVNGLVPVEELGMIAPHEHIFCDTSGDYREPPEEIKSLMAELGVDLEAPITLKSYGFLMREPQWSIYNQILDSYEDARDELAILKRAGVKTVIDPTPIGLGRNPVLLRRVAQELDMNLVTGTGYYRNAFHPPEVEEMTAEEIEERIVRDLMEGMDGTDIRAGMIGELGTTGGNIFPREEKVLIAGGRAQFMTGAPLMVHTEGRREIVMRALKILEENGANLEKVHICHVNGASWWRDVVETGATMGYDTFGSTFNVDSEVRFGNNEQKDIDQLLRIFDAGYGDKVFMANDICMKMRLHKYGGWGYDHILTNLVPHMKKAGFTAEHFRLLFEENPKQWLNVGKA